MTTNELPKGYTSWLQFVIANRAVIEQCAHIKYDTPEFCAKPAPTDMDSPVETARINVDFAKARALEELTKQIPDEEEIEHALYCLGTYPSIRPGVDLSATKALVMNFYNAIH